MRMNKKRMSLLVIIVVLAAVFTYIFFAKTPTVSLDERSASDASAKSSEEPPLLIKSLPIRLDKYNSKTNKAGDLRFTKQKFTFDLLFSDYGFLIAANSAGPAKKSPQPTFIAPLGTKVRSLVDGVVLEIPTLWSGDKSIMVGTSSSSKYRYETEHVIRPIVKVGDKVKAGQVIAEVSDYDSKNTPGYGLVEMGILKGGNPPTHLCPFAYLDPSIKEKTFSNLRSLYTSWNAYLGKKVYKTTPYAVPGCLTQEEIPG